MTTFPSPRNTARSVRITEDVPEAPSQRFRDAIASRSEDYAVAFPHSVTVEADALLGMSEAINGSAVELSGTRSVEGFRGALRGEKNFHFADLCRLATTPAKESRAAARAALTVLAAAIGYRLEAMNPDVPDAHEALAGVVESFGQFGSEMSRNLIDDGKIDRDEARGLRPSLERLKAKVARAEAVINEAELS